MNKSDVEEVIFENQATPNKRIKICRECELARPVGTEQPIPLL